MAKKPPFDPSKPYSAPKQEKPAFNPNEGYKAVNDTVVHNDNFNPYPTQQGDLEPILNEIVRTSKGGEMGDTQKDILRDILKNPNTTPEQAKESIQTFQGYHPKQKDNEYAKFYLKKDENGVLVPKPLAYGERPPEGYDVASAWGNPKQAKNDAWYTDAAKTLANGVLEGAKGAIALGQLATNAIADKDSQYLNELTNTAERLKFTKDEDLNKQVYNTEGVKQFSDLVSKDRFDISPESLWGTINMVGESIVPFFMGAGATSRVVKGVTGAEKLGKAGQLGSAYVGSSLSMLSDNLDHVKDAGLRGRDAASVAGLTTAVQSTIETMFGLPPQIWSKTLPKQAGSELISRLIANVERDAEGKITEAGFKQLAKDAVETYSEIATKSMGKDFLKDVGKESFTEGSQDFTAKAAEQLWDKFSDEDKAKFGTKINSPKSFASYIQNAIAGAVGGAPMGAANAVLDNYNKQSETAFNVVSQGKESIDEFKANVYQQWRQGDLTETQRDQALFKIDSYDKYNKQTTDYPNMSDADKKQAFELSFNIDALKSETKFSPEEISKLDPIAKAKIKAKETLIDGLQKELNHIVLKQDIQQETKVAEDTINKAAKQEGLEPKTDKDGNKKSFSLEDLAEKVTANPAPKKVREKIDAVTPERWVKMSVEKPPEIKGIVQEHLKNTPNNEMDVTIHSDKNGRYVFMVGEGKPVRFAQSVKGREDSKTPDYFRRENLPSSKIFIEDRGGNTNQNEQGEPEHYFKESAVVKRVEFESENDKGEPMIKAVLPVYNAQSGKFIGFAKETRTGSSKYDSRSDKAHLRHIMDANILNDSLKGYEHNAEQKAAAPPLRHVDVEEYVQDYIDGTLEATPENEQFASNNSKAIDAEFKRVYKENEAKAEKEKIKQKPESKRKQLAKVIGQTAATYEEAVIGFLLTKDGKINKDDFIRYTGFGAKNKLTGKKKGAVELKNYEWALDNNNASMPIDTRAKVLWVDSMNRDEADFNESEAIQEIIDTILEYDKNPKTNLANRLFEIQKEAAESQDAYASPEMMRYAEEVEAAENAYYDSEYSDLLNYENSNNNDGSTDVLPPPPNKKQSKYPHSQEFIDIAKDDFDVKIIPFKESWDLKGYSPNIQMKFNQGDYYESVTVIVPEQIKSFYAAAKIPVSKRDSGTKNYISMMQKKYGIHEIDFVQKIKDIAKKYRDKNEAKIVEILPKRAQLQKKKDNITPDDSIDLNKSESIDFVFKSYPKLKELFGNNKSLYNKYLNSIFPNSKVKDIVYHGSDSKLIGEQFDKSKAFVKTDFIYFTNKEYAKEFMIGKNSVMYSVLVDLKNPLIHNSQEFNSLPTTLKNLDNRYDGVVNESGDSYSQKSEEYIVREPKQIHIIGSKQDLLNAKAFLNSNDNIGITPDEAVKKIVDRMRIVLPKFKIDYDSKLNVAGQIQGNKILINPFYAGNDTPIHEVGHALIDFIGYNNKVIQKAIKQLENTDLWKETKERYPELSDEMLGKEVLAEAIGREGANIFDKKVEESKFKALLSYIFDKLKTMLGINKNIAKSLAKQIISGVGTKSLQGTNEVAQEQKPKKPKKEQTPEEKSANKIMDWVKEHGLSELNYEQLVEIYNSISAQPELRGKGTHLKELERRIALNLKERGLENSQKQISQGKLAAKDIGWFDKWFKVLSWFDDSFPEMKEFSKMWNTAFFAKMKEARAEKNTHDKLAKEVVAERNKKLGLSVERGKELLSNRTYKAFEYLDNGKGKILTMDEAKAKKLSEAQTKYLKYVRDLLIQRQELAADADINNIELDLIKLDKGFSEAFESDGFVAAVGSFFGNNNQLTNTVITFTNPNTGKQQKAKFGDAQKIIADYGLKGIKEKAKATLMMVRAGFAAKYQLKRDVEEGLVDVAKSEQITVDEQGNLKSRFSGERAATRAYSKDFYNSMSQYIDDSMHIKHISPLVPIVNSINTLLKEGAFDEGEIIAGKGKNNLKQWMDMWTKLHILQKPDENDPTLDAALKTLRFATSGITMWFNVAANLMNVAIGNYNNWRQENGATWAKGQKRLFGNIKYSSAILDKYVTVSSDIDSNPFRKVKNRLAELGFLGQKWGEWQIQGSGLLGLMKDEDYNSFEFKKNKYGIDELVVKEGVDKKALEDRILTLIDRVSDIQGKYSAKDRMNIMNNEMGKIAMQFKTWMPAWGRSRFGDEGSYRIAMRNFMKDGLKDLKAELKKDGFVKTYKNNVAFAQNLRGALAVGFLAALAYNDDDDKEKSEASKIAQKALSDVLFIFDPNKLKFTLTRPVAAAGTIEKFINAFEHLIYLEEYKGDSKYGDKGDLKIQGDLLSATPAGNVVKAADMLSDEE